MTRRILTSESLFKWLGLYVFLRDVSLKPAHDTTEGPQRRPDVPHGKCRECGMRFGRLLPGDAGFRLHFREKRACNPTIRAAMHQYQSVSMFCEEWGPIKLGLNVSCLRRRRTCAVVRRIDCPAMTSSCANHPSRHWS